MLRLVVLILLISAVTGCGGGGDGGTGGEVPLSAGDHYLLFMASDTATLPVPISTVDFGFKLPGGTTVATADNGSKAIQQSSLMASGPFASAVYGSYSAASTGGSVHVNLVAVESAFRTGQLVELKFTVPVGQTVYASAITTPTPNFWHYQVTGIDGDNNSIILTDRVRVGVQVAE